MTIRHTADFALVPVPKIAPARFESYDPAIQQRAFELWCSIAGRSGARVVRLLGSEFGEDVALPTASTINRWAAAEGWTAKADADLKRSHGRTLYELQVGWLAGLQLAQKTLLDGMAGEFDDLPMGGAGRLKSAEITLRVIERAGLLALLPQFEEPESSTEFESMSQEEQESWLRSRLRQRKRRE
jgi:hypothetical protein